MAQVGAFSIEPLLTAIAGRPVWIHSCDKSHLISHSFVRSVVRVSETQKLHFYWVHTYLSKWRNPKQRPATTCRTREFYLLIKINGKKSKLFRPRDRWQWMRWQPVLILTFRPNRQPKIKRNSMKFVFVVRCPFVRLRLFISIGSSWS